MTSHVHLAEFTVVGTPVPQGSMRSFERGGRTFTKSSNAGPLERWRGDIRAAVPEQLAALPPETGAVGLRLMFRFARPASHFWPANSRRPTPVLRADAPVWVTKPPDGDKLDRAVMDALTGIVYVDDAQVVQRGSTKRYAEPGERPGVDILAVRL